MKILTLNTWGGRAGREGLLNFLKRESETVDVFCLQEVWSAPYEHLEGTSAGGLAISNQNVMTYGMQDISAVLSEYEYFFHPHLEENYGLLMLVKKGNTVIGSGDVFVHKERGYVPQGDVGHHARNIQFVTLEQNGKQRTIINFHGLWNGKGKGDSDDRLEQSRRIVAFIQTLPGEVVLCGDFNLLPDTESIRILEHSGLRNLVREYNVTSTRTTLYSKAEKFADYIFVSRGLTVKDFRVLPDEVSDHAPLVVELA